MDVYTRINRLLQQVQSRGLDTEKVTIYAEGVKEKLRQVDYAIKSHQITRGNPDF